MPLPKIENSIFGLWAPRPDRRESLSLKPVPAIEGFIMSRARLTIIVRSICCSKLKGVDQDVLGRDSTSSEEDGDAAAESSSGDSRHSESSSGG